LALRLAQAAGHRGAATDRAAPSSVASRCLAFAACGNIAPVFTTVPAMKLLSTAFCSALLMFAGASPAQMFKDPAFESMYQAERIDDLAKAASQRLSSNPDDTQAVLALGLAALSKDNADARRHALTRAEACNTRDTKAAACQYTHGVLLGVQAMSEGIMKAARSIGTVRQALQAAHELEPSWYPARSALVEFYVEVPGMLGGGIGKAEELAKSAPLPEQAKALQARALLGDKKPEAALALLLALPANLEPNLASDVQSWTMQSGMQLVNAKQPAKALPAFERLLRDKPGNAAGHYGLARAKGELGDWAEALSLLEKSAKLKGAGNWPVAYRIGIAQQQLGQTDAAKASFKSFIDAGKGQKNSLEDARKRLEQLGG
jgi:tetratricopeptide (TPR) repeat protein